MSLDFMAAVTICSDFGTPQNKVSLFPLFPHLFGMSDGTAYHDLGFLTVELKPAFSLPPLSLSRGL